MSKQVAALTAQFADAWERCEALTDILAAQGIETVTIERSWRANGIELQFRAELFWRVVDRGGYVHDFEEDAESAWKKFIELAKQNAQR